MDMLSEIKIEYGQTFKELYPILKSFRDKGGKKEKALTFLEELRKNFYNTDKEDVILELLDIVSGFCSKPLRLWN